MIGSVNYSPHLREAYVDISFSRWDIAADVDELVYWFPRPVTHIEDGCYFLKTYELCFIYIYVEVDTSSCLLQSL